MDSRLPHASIDYDDDDVRLTTMPTSQQILAGLEEISNQWQVLAIFWHVYFGALALAFGAGARPTKRVMGVSLAVPLVSVSGLAWLHGNPFNGSVFALVGIALIVIAARLPRDRSRVAPWWSVTSGWLMFVFGWVYPHFLDTPSPLAYLYAAPTGLIPCPTLSIVAGLSLVLGSLGSRAWAWVLGAAGLFYSVFGAVRLGVAIDWVLLFGALMVMFGVVVDTDELATRRQ